MNQHPNRATQERFAQAMAEKRRRQAKTEMSQRGYRDEDTGEWRGGLLAFIRYYWHILEPGGTAIGGIAQGSTFKDGWALEVMCEHLEAVTFGEIDRLLINVPPGFMKSLLTDVFWPAWEWGPMDLAHVRYVAFSYSAGITERDNDKFGILISSPEYQSMWGARVRVRKKGQTEVSNYKHGRKLATSVGGLGTGERGDRIILDDPHNVKESESETVRNETVRWFREAMSNRLNDVNTGAIVIIMQRVHEADVSGTILEVGMDYVHLMIPMEFDWDRVTDDSGQPIPNDFGWIDPRWLPNREDCQGALAWPERFDENGCEKLQKDVGPHAWCNPYEAPVLMRDLSLRPIGEVREGDAVLGFNIGNDGKRARLSPATVLSISRSYRRTVKITLESGNVIRCTPDHKWWTGRNDVSHPPYAPANPPRKGRKTGSVLRRICPPKIDFDPTPENLRLAGWVAGFFDGEGSVSANKRRDDSLRNPNITFFQTADRNEPLCAKLEQALKRLGFEFGVHHKTRINRWQPCRSYWLKALSGDGSTRKGKTLSRLSRLSMYQRFLHVIQPVKWRERLIELASHGRVFSADDRVVSIEEGEIEEVFGLETTTGNYVVWGLASSNSGQYQQTPKSRGTSIISAEYWQLWEADDGKFPAFEYIVASLDSAFTEKEQNDPSALTLWGVFLNEHRRRRIMLIHAWRKRLKLNGVTVPIKPGEHESMYRKRSMPHWGLVQWAADTCRRFQADKLLIEAKANGIDVANELRRQHARELWDIEMINPRTDKVARAVAVQPSWSQGLVYAPDREWAQMVIDEMDAFPKGRYKDLTDSATQAMRHLRALGFASSDEEVVAEEREAVKPQKKRGPLYPTMRG